MTSDIPQMHHDTRRVLLAGTVITYKGVPVKLLCDVSVETHKCNWQLIEKISNYKTFQEE